MMLYNRDSTGYFGKWTLVSMSGSIPNSETTGAAMEWQEFYLFNTNGTFTKSEKEIRLKPISGTHDNNSI
jgi:arylsulfatase A-like enzyme